MKKYRERIQSIDKKEFFLRELFFIGFSILDLFKIDEQRAQKYKSYIYSREVYTQKKAVVYNYNLVSASITYFVFFLMLTICLSVVIKDKLFFFFGICACLFVFYYPFYKVKESAKARRMRILNDYIAVLLKFILLMNTGMVLSEAFKIIAFSEDGEFYSQMRLTQKKMNNGMSMSEALFEFTDSCNIREVKKFVSVLSQSTKKGSKELIGSLNLLMDETMEKRKNEAKTQGELASQKLLIPIIIMFIGIIIMITVPVFVSMT